MNLVQNHSKSHNKYMINVRKHFNTVCVLSKQYICHTELTFHLQYQMTDMFTKICYNFEIQLET
jgi:hypothetical protein